MTMLQLEPMARKPGRDVTPAAALRSRCPIAGALDIVGDRWTLLVMRDLLFYRKRRFADFAASPEGVATNILADRLARLEAQGLIRRRRYQDHPPRDEYRVTARGHDLLPVLRSLIHWGQAHVPGVAQKPPAKVTIPPRPSPEPETRRKSPSVRR
jgi:DNA-binding HxlR family transcriptional regulator